MTTILQEPSPTSIRRVAHARTGLDIGAHSAKLVVAEWRANCWRITSASSLRLPTGTLANATELARILKPWLREHAGLGNCDLVCSLPSAMVDYEAIELKGLAEVEEVAQESLQQLLGTQAAQATSDYWCGRTTVAGQPTEYLYLAWTGNDFAAGLANQLQGVAGRFLAIDPAATALARLACGSTPRQKSSLVVDLGDGEVSLVWVSGGTAQYVRNRIRFAANSAAVELTTALKITVPAAETILAAWGVGDPRIAPTGSLEAAVEQHLTEWLQKLRFEIARTIGFIQHRYHAAAVPEIVLCGGGACIRGLARCLGTKVNVPVRNADLPVDWVWEAAETYSPIYAPAVALTQYGETL